jgi:hypothetical protein
VLLACIRNLGVSPCPRCLIKREYIKDLGTQADSQRRAKLRTCDKGYRFDIETVREIIYKKGYVVNSEAVNDIIGPKSYTPTRVSRHWPEYISCADLASVTECLCFGPS